MADTIFTRALRQAAAFQASTQALAYALRVPEATLLRWMSGRAQMPVRAFHELVRLLCEHEARNAHAGRSAACLEPASFNLGPVQARCPGCGATQFLAAAPAPELRMTSRLRCASCNQEAMQGDLLRALATAYAVPSRTAQQRLERADAALAKSSALLASAHALLSRPVAVEPRAVADETMPADRRGTDVW